MSIGSRAIRYSGKVVSSSAGDGREWSARFDEFIDHRAVLDFALRALESPAGEKSADPGPAPASNLQLGAPSLAPDAVPLPPEPSLQVASTLAAGQAAIIGYNTGQNNESPAQAATLDKLHFVLLDPVGSGTQIFITDRTWTPTPGSTAIGAGTFAAAGGGDATLTWTAGADLAAGTVVSARITGGNVIFTVNGVDTAPVSAGGFDIDHATGDTLYMYQGAINAPTHFLHAAEFADGNATFNASLVNTGLSVAAGTAVAVAFDSGAYNGPTTHAESFLWNGHASTLLHSIADSTNWVGDDSTGDNAREQEVQNGPWLRHADVEFWGTMASGGLANTLRDTTHQSGNDDYNHTRQYDGMLFPVGHPQAGQNVFVSLRDMVFDTVDGKFFLVDSNIQGVNRILQGNISDLIANPTGVPTLTVLWSYTQVALELDGRLDNIELDLANNIVYFTAGSKLYKVNYDTASQAGTMMFDANGQGGFSATTGNPAGSTNNFFNDMVINFATGHIYISSTRVTSGASDQINKNFIYDLSGLTTGSGVNAFTMNGGANTGTARLLPFVENDDVYNPTPGTTHTPATTAQQPYFWPNERGSLDGLAIDPVTNILYFSTGEILFDHDLSSGTAAIYSGGVIASYALTGNPTGIATILHQQTAQFGGAIPGLMGDLEVDLTNGHLYVLDYTGINGVNDDNHWFRMNIGGSTPIQFTQTIGDPDGFATVGLTLNHAPTLSGNGLAAAVTEASNAPLSGETTRPLLFNTITIADVDTTTADEITGAVIRIGQGFTFEAASTAPGHTATVDFLRINGNTSGTIAGSGISYTYNQTTGAMVLTGAATVAEYKAALELVTFSTSGDNVTSDGNSVTRTVFASVSDGLTMSDEISVTVTVTGINDAPVNTVGGALNFTEDTVGTAGVPAPPPAPVNAITGLAIADADADATTETFIVTLSVANGTLNIRTDVVGGLTAGNVTGNGTGSLVLTGTQTQINTTLAAVNNVAAANGLVYTPNANFNGADTLVMVTNDQGNNGNDPGATGDGDDERDTDNKTLNVADVNDAPTVIDATQDSPTILEDVPFTNLNAPTVSSLFAASFSDATDVQQTGGNPTGSAGDTFAGIAIVSATSNANGAWQYWDGDSWENITGGTQAAARTLTAGTQLRFNPTLNYNGPAPTLTVHLIESGGPAITNNGAVNLSPVGTATGGTTVYSALTVVLAQDITPVNDAPTSTQLNGDSAVFLEGGPALLIDVAPQSTLTDVDSADFSGGSLSIAITSGRVDSEDILSVGQSTILLSNGTNVGSVVSIGGVPFGTVTSDGAGGDPLTFSFTSAALVSAVRQLIHAITYQNSSANDPTDGVRTITWTLVDGDGVANNGADTMIVTSTVDVDPVNDAPQGADATYAFDEDGSRILSQADFGYSDPLDGDGFAGVVITTLPTNGVLRLNGVPIALANTFVTAAQIAGNQLVFHSDLNENGTPYATFTFQVRDNGGILDGGQDTDQSANTLTFNVDPINDAPVNTVPGAQSVNEDGTLTFNAANGNLISIADVDAGAADLTTTVSIADGALNVGATMAGLSVSGAGTNSLILVGTLAEINDALDGLTYTPPANANGPRTLTITTNDGGATGADPGATGGAADEQDSDPIAITINSVNDEPAGTDATVTASEDDPYVFLTTDFGFTDPIDGDDFAGVVLTTLPVEGDLRLNGVNITVAGTFITAADIAAGLLTFLADPDESGDNYASFTFQVRDDGGILFGGVDTDQSANTITIDVEPDNIAPTLDLDGDDSNTVGTGYTASFTEGGAAVSITDTDVAIVDPDVGSTIEGATITVNGAVTGDQLILADQAAPFVVTGSGTGTITITGSGTAAQYEAMLEQITFTNTSDDPGTTRTINITVTDGISASNVAVATINITEVNDEPTLTATAVNPTFTEGGAAADLFSGVTADTIEAGQTFVSLTLTVTNVTDGADEILVVGGMNVALTNGNVVATPAGNATVTLAAGTATVVVGPSTLSEAALQTLIDGLAYLNTSENPTDADRVVTITELVDSGSDTSPNDATLAPNIASTVNVNPVNDAPLNTVPGTQTINEDASVTLSTGNGNAIQVADADATTLTVTLTVQDGTLTLASTAGLSFGPGDGTGDLTMTFTGTAAAINAALSSGLTYNPNADFNGSDSIAVFTTDDGQSGGATQTDSDSVTINITAINDAPVRIGDGTESATTIDEDTPGAGQTIQALFSGQYSDAADNQVPNGGASSPGPFSGIAVTANGSSAATGQWQYFSGGVWTDIGAVSDAAAKLLGDPSVTLIRFNPAPDFNGPAPTLTVHLIDDSLGFGIVNGQVVDLSGPGATGGTTAYSTGTVVLSQSVTAVNDGPLNTVPGAQTIDEDASFTLSNGNGNAIQVADADATTLTVTLTVLNGTLTLASTAGLSFSGGSDGTADVTMTFSGAGAAINVALGSGLTYNPTANYNGPDSIAVLTTDNGQTGTGGTLQDNDSIAITVNSVNDAPSGANNTLTGSEDDPLVLTAADFGFTDPIDGNAFLAVIIDTFPANGTLFLDTDGPGGNPPTDLSTLGPGVFVNVSDINLGRLYFQPDTDEFGDNYATFTFRVQDDGGMLNGGVDRDPTANTITINITPDNLAPEVDLNGAGAGLDAAVSYTEDAPGVSIGSGIAVSDPNEVTGDLIESATITLTDAVAGDALTVGGALPGGIIAVTTNPAGQIVVTLSGAASTADYAAAIAQILYSSSNQDPTLGGTDPTRTITVTVNDGLLSSAVATSTVTITPLDDAAVAQPDAFTTDEATTIVAGNVFAANPTLPDADPDGPPLQVGAVNGLAGNVGVQITLASGALLTLNANGTFNYNPNGQFNSLPGPASGASNLSGTDTFTYTLVGGNTVMVTITVTGVDSNGDILLGTPGVDSLDGGIGADHMTGFAGNDTYFVDNAGDTVVEVAGEGSDTIRTSISYTLGAALDVETLTTTSQAGTGAIDLAGNGLNNRIEGNDGVNLLAGNGGLDRLFGFGGDDILNGGAGNDELDGGAGIDRALYAGGIGFADTLVGWVVVSAEGSDLLERVEIAVAGSGQRNLLVGSTAFGTIQAASGAAGTGDNIRLAAGSYAEAVSYDDSGLQVLAQTGAVQNVTYTTLSGFGISVYGANLADTIATGDGDDTLSGGGGIDHLSGGAGNDIYHVTEAGDVVTELALGGADIIYSAVSYALSGGSEVEALATLSFEGTASLNLTGNGLNNYLIGNDGNNQLDGRGGADVMVGRAGGDIYLVDNVGDQVFEDENGGYDVIYSAASYTLTNDQEIEGLSTITWESAVDLDLTGNSAGNYLIGNAGKNKLDGKDGNDVLQGKEGMDQFIFTTALGTNNIDTIFDFDFGGAEDMIVLDKNVFTGLVDGPLDPGAFVVGTAAADGDDHIIYDDTTGQLYFDSDGMGGDAAVLFAVLQNAPLLTAGDFTVI